MSDSWLDTIHAPLVDLIQKKSRLSLRDLSADTRLKDVLSSMAMLELILEIEEKFEIELPLTPDILDRLSTVGLAIETVQRAIREQNPPKA